MRVRKSFNVVLCGTGALGAVAAQVLTGWWLNSGRGVVCTVAVLFVLAVGFSMRGGSLKVQTVSLWTGAMTGLTIWLFWTGPGTIWPIVLVVAGGIVFVTLLLGGGLGRLLGRAMLP